MKYSELNEFTKVMHALMLFLLTPTVMVIGFWIYVLIWER
jgi:hypothetical protein